MPSHSAKNIIIDNKRTSIRLEKQMWDSFKEIADREKLTINQLATEIYSRIGNESSLSSSIRLFIMMYYKAAATNRGHDLAGHGKLKKQMKAFSSKPEIPDYSKENIIF